MGKRIDWTDTALHHLNEIYLHILEESKSINIVGKIVDDLYSSANILKTQAEIWTG